jgi:hypothetical protein
MEMGGIEPPTSCLQSRRSPTELHPLAFVANGLTAAAALLGLVRVTQWAYLDSNQGPQLYQSCALAN